MVKYRESQCANTRNANGIIYKNKLPPALMKFRLFEKQFTISQVSKRDFSEKLKC